MVRSATVARVLPDGIFVQDSASVILLFEFGASRGRGKASCVWLDEDAVEMGEFSSRQPKLEIR